MAGLKRGKFLPIAAPAGMIGASNFFELAVAVATVYSDFLRAPRSRPGWACLPRCLSCSALFSSPGEQNICSKGSRMIDHNDQHIEIEKRAMIRNAILKNYGNVARSRSTAAWP
jgi:hypothetical protein